MTYPIPPVSRLASLSRDPRFWRNFFPKPACFQVERQQLAPDFELFDVVAGRSRRLSQSLGQGPILLAFTRIFQDQVYCPFCYPHIVDLNAAYEQFQRQGAEVFLISSTTPEQSQRVVEDLSLRLPLLCDPACQTFRQYGLGQALGAPLPGQFWVDAAGIIRYRHYFSFFDSNAQPDELLSIPVKP